MQSSKQANFRLPTVVQMVPVNAIALPPRRIRRHSEAKQRKLARSISETGYFSPLALDENNQIIAGTARLDAAKRLGMEVVPAIVLTGLSDLQKKALRIALNRLPEDAQWDPEKLALDLQEIIDGGLELELTGFDAIDVDRLLTPSVDLGPDDEVIEEPPTEPITRLGDIWQCGEHLICCGDARDPKVYEALLGGKKAAMVITDPPYNLEIGKEIATRGKAKHPNFVMGAGEMSDGEFVDFLREVMSLTSEHSKNGSLHYWFIDWRHVSELVAVGKSVFAELINICVWAKLNWGMGAFYRSQHEMVVVMKNGDASHINNVQRGRLGRNRSNIWQYAGGTSFSKSREHDLAAHPTVKPVLMIADAIRDASSPHDIVLDPFGGSGTTILAAQAIGRRAFVIELDPRYVDVSIQRFHRKTSIEPALVGSNLAPQSVTKTGNLCPELKDLSPARA